MQPEVRQAPPPGQTRPPQPSHCVRPGCTNTRHNLRQDSFFPEPSREWEKPQADSQCQVKMTDCKGYKLSRTEGRSISPGSRQASQRKRHLRRQKEPRILPFTVLWEYGISAGYFRYISRASGLLKVPDIIQSCSTSLYLSGMSIPGISLLALS